jgi:hypothetical protein
MQNFTLRLEDELRAAIEAAAEQDRRPVGNFIRCVLSDWLKSQDRPGDRNQARA